MWITPSLIYGREFIFKFQKGMAGKDQTSMWQALGLAWQLGYTIAIPIVVFGLAGRWLDKKYGTSPLLLLVGIFFATIVSSLSVYRKALHIVEGEDDKGKEDVSDGKNSTNKNQNVG